MTPSLGERLRQRRRLIILQLLAAMEDRRLDLSLLGMALRDMNHEMDRTVLQGEVRQLERQGLVQVNAALEIWSLTLTARGDQVQRGVIEEPGVARPDLA